MEILDAIEGFVWGPFVLIPLLLGTGLYLTVRLRLVQLRKLGPALHLAVVRRKDATQEGEISHYQALTTALAATVGVGNIAGVATAFYFGGPGALFWMWLIGLLGMATKYSESFLGVRFRTRDARGQVSGGPQHYLARVIPNRFGLVLSVLFAVFAVIASFGIGNMVQSNTVAAALEETFAVPPWAAGVAMAVLAGAVMLGGIKTIGTVTAGFVPLMIGLYVGGALLVLVLNVGDIPAALGVVFTDAFTGTAAVGGFAGAGIMAAIQWGVARGIFSNESGMGSAGITAAAARTRHPVRQGLVAMTQTFIDTLIVASMTGLVIVTTGVWDTGLNGVALTTAAFEAGIGPVGPYIVTFGVVTFAFSAVFGWSYYGERCVVRLFGARGALPYRVVFVIAIFVGSTLNLTAVWAFAGIANGLMALPNLIGLLACAGLIARETKAYLDRDPDLRHEPEVSTMDGTAALDAVAPGSRGARSVSSG